MRAEIFKCFTVYQLTVRGGWEQEVKGDQGDVHTQPGPGFAAQAALEAAGVGFVDGDDDHNCYFYVTDTEVAAALAALDGKLAYSPTTIAAPEQLAYDSTGEATGAVVDGPHGFTWLVKLSQ